MSLLSVRGHTACVFLSSNSYTSRIGDSIIFILGGSHTKRAMRTGSSTTAATVAHFSDDRGRIQARMVNGTALRFLFLSSALLSIVREYLVFGSPRASRRARLLLRSRSCRSAVPPVSLPFLSLPYPDLAAAHTGTHSDQ